LESGGVVFGADRMLAATRGRGCILRTYNGYRWKFHHQLVVKSTQ